MDRRLEVKCSNCGAINQFNEADLVSGVPTKDVHGRIIQEFPPVTVDHNTVVACEKCRYPMNCANAKVLS